MGLFKESLTDYVGKQIEVRQKLIQIKEKRSGEAGSFQPGAFHAYTTNKYCSMRMSSCVDITKLD